MKHFPGIAFLITPLLCLFATHHRTNAQSNLQLEVRPRLIVKEVFAGGEIADPSHIAFITQRSRAGLIWKKKALEAVFTIQDIRYWGGDNIFNERGVHGNHQSLSLHNAYFSFNAGLHWQWRIGRQLMAFDDERLISFRNWNDYQVSYDALRLSFRGSKIETDLVLSYNSDNNKTAFYPAQKYRTLNYLRVGSNHPPHFSYSLSTLLSGKMHSDTSTAVHYLQTWSGYVNFDKNQHCTLSLSAHYQYSPGNTETPHSAYCLSALFGLRAGKASGIKVGIDWISGKESLSLENTWRSFDLHYGKRHGFYGLMDFYSQPPEQGLIDIFAKYEHLLPSGQRLQVHIHSFQLENDYVMENGKNEGKNLGLELDLVGDFQINPYTTLQAGYGYYLDTSLSRLLKQAPPAGTSIPQFCYLMLQMKIPDIPID